MDWSSDVCSSDLPGDASMAIVEGLLQIARDLEIRVIAEGIETDYQAQQLSALGCHLGQGYLYSEAVDRDITTALLLRHAQGGSMPLPLQAGTRSEEHTSELQSLMRIPNAVFCLHKKKTNTT